MEGGRCDSRCSRQVSAHAGGLPNMTAGAAGDRGERDEVGKKKRRRDGGMCSGAARNKKGRR
jgi:hypothetical protein